MALLARGQIPNSVQYSDGILCYMEGDLVRILDVHGASETEDVIDMVKLMAELPGHWPNTRLDQVGIFYYQNGMLTMRLISGTVNAGDPILVVINVRRDFVSTPQSPSRVRKILQGPPNTIPAEPMHVMTNGDYICCVVNTANVAAWTLKCYDLNKPEEEASIIKLHEFLPRGKECRFKLLDGWVYAICRNENGPYRRGDRKKQLYYNCCRFPIDNFGPAEKPEDFLGPSQYTPLPARLQAVQSPRGSGEFLWKRVCLDLVQDERTGDLFIVESEAFTESPESDRPYRRVSFPDPKKHTNLWEETISEIVQTMEEVPSSFADEANDSSRYETREEETRRPRTI